MLAWLLGRKKPEKKSQPRHAPRLPEASSYEPTVGYDHNPYLGVYTAGGTLSGPDPWHAPSGHHHSSSDGGADYGGADFGGGDCGGGDCGGCGGD